MKWWLIHSFTDFVALWLVMIIVPGIHSPDDIAGLVIATIIFGLLNVLIRSMLWLLTFPLILATVGPIIVINKALVLWSSAWLSGQLGIGFSVDGFTPALLGAVIISMTQVTGVGLARSEERRRVSRREQLWLDELEMYKAWLVEQQANWQRLAEKREHIIEAQQNLTYSLRQDEASLEVLQTRPSYSFETETVSWRQRIYLLLYYWHEPFYHWYEHRGWTWLAPFKEKIKQSLLRQN